LEKVFQMFDRVSFVTHFQDSNGQISKTELQQIMGGVEIDEEQWKHILDECDKNGDGEVPHSSYPKISLPEFIELMQSYH
jgi:calcium-dependent protein kinase